jgi:hypothetical protein
VDITPVPDLFSIVAPPLIIIAHIDRNELEFICLIDVLMICRRSPIEMLPSRILIS